MSGVGLRICLITALPEFKVYREIHVDLTILNVNVLIFEETLMFVSPITVLVSVDA